MADKDVKRSSPPESTKKDPPKASTKKVQERISIEQHLSRLETPVDKYSRSFLQSKYRGILKTTEEWEKEISGKI